MSEWSLIDVERRRRRLSETAFRNAVYEAALDREKIASLRPNRANHSAKTIGTIGRSILVSWIFAESEEKHLKPSTAFLAVNYLERVLSEAPVKLGKVQEVAVVCLQIATKIDATGGDSMDLPYRSNLSTAELEPFALQLLDWQLVVPTAWTFFSMFSEKFWLPIESRRKALIYLKNIMYCELLPITLMESQATSVLTCSSSFRESAFLFFCTSADQHSSSRAGYSASGTLQGSCHGYNQGWAALCY